MKSRYRVLNVLLVIGTLSTFLLIVLFLNLTASSTYAGEVEPTQAAYLPLVIQQGEPNSTPTVMPTAVPTATATPNPEEFENIEFDPLGPEQPVLEQLSAGQAHLYPVLFDYDGAITITAVAESTINLVLEIRDAANDIVTYADNSGSGQPEAIVDAQLNPALDYKIRVYDRNGAAGSYCLIFSEGGGFPDLIKGRIEYGQTKTSTLEVLGIDYWCFMAASGDNVSISVAPTGSDGDLVVGLFGPPDFAAIGPAFQEGEILNVDLEVSGLHIIGILDFEAGTPEYALTLTKN
jgi:hypothetical protein